MIYSYFSVEELPPTVGGVNHPLQLGTASAEQVLVRAPFGIHHWPSGEFSSEFSSEFGAPGGVLSGQSSAIRGLLGAIDPYNSQFVSTFGVSGLVPYGLMITKFIQGADTEQIGFTNAASAHVYFQPPFVVLAGQTAKAVAAATHVFKGFVLAAAAYKIVVPRRYPSVVAAKNPEASSIVKGSGHRFGIGGPWSPGFISTGFGGGGGAGGTDTFQPMRSVATLAVGRGRSVGVAASSVAKTVRGMLRSLSAVGSETGLLLKAVGRLSRAVDGSAARLVLPLGRFLGALSGEAVSIARGMPWHLFAASTQAAASVEPSPRVKNLIVASPQALAVLRKVSLAGVGTTSAYVSRLGRSLARIFAVAGSSQVLLSRLPSLVRGVLSPDVAGGARQAVLPRGTSGGWVAGLLYVMARRPAPFAATDPQQAAEIGIHARPLSVGAASPQAAFSWRNLTQTVPKLFAALSTQAVSLARGTAKLTGALSSETLALRRGITTTLAAVVAQQLAPRIIAVSQAARAVLSGQVVAARSSYSRIYHVLSGQVVVVARGQGRAYAAASAQSLLMVRAMLRLMAGVSGQAAATLRLVAKAPFTVLSAQVPTAYRQFFRTLVVAAAEAIAVTARRGSRFAGVIGTSATAMQRSVAKLVPLAAVQAVGGGRGIFRAFAVVSASIARSFTPRGTHLGQTTSSQLVSVARWYFPFVSQWQRQQSVLLPMAGGPAEPPGFGPIDPMDRTLFGFDWTARTPANDAVASAVVVSVPPGLNFSGPVNIRGGLVQVTVTPFIPPQNPMTYQLRCTATFVSGRRSSFSIPVPVRTL
jgi:hypothetical protein